MSPLARPLRADLAGVCLFARASAPRRPAAAPLPRGVLSHLAERGAIPRRPE